jgi:hypothetical protein
MDSGRTLNGYASRRGSAPGSGVTRPARPGRLPAAYPPPTPAILTAGISAVLTGARGDHARCGAPRPPCRAGHGPAPPIRRKAAPNSSDSTRPSASATIRMIPTVLRLNPEVVTSTAKVKMAPTTNRKTLTPRLKATRLLQEASTVDRSPSPACIGCRRDPVYRIPCPALLLRFLTSTARKSRRGLDASTPERPTPISTINSVPSASIARRPPSLPCIWSRWSWACGLPAPRASYRSAPERVSTM